MGGLQEAGEKRQEARFLRWQKPKKLRKIINIEQRGGNHYRGGGNWEQKVWMLEGSVTTAPTPPSPPPPSQERPTKRHTGYSAAFYDDAADQ